MVELQISGLEANEIPRADADPMRPDDFDPLVRAARWTAISPYVRSHEGAI